MNKIQKILSRLTIKECRIVRNILQRLKANKITGLDIKKLSGSKDIFRVRRGNLRIIYRVIGEGIIILVAISRRNEHTYKF